MKSKLKLFVWEGVLAEYTSGIAFAYARDITHARNLIAKSLGYSVTQMRLHHIALEIMNNPPTKITTRAFGKAIYGGG
jgi:hypothetical protein